MTSFQYFCHICFHFSSTKLVFLPTFCLFWGGRGWADINVFFPNTLAFGLTVHFHIVFDFIFLKLSSIFWSFLSNILSYVFYTFPHRTCSLFAFRFFFSFNLVFYFGILRGGYFSISYFAFSLSVSEFQTCLYFAIYYLFFVRFGMVFRRPFFFNCPIFVHFQVLF